MDEIESLDARISRLEELVRLHLDAPAKLRERLPEGRGPRRRSRNSWGSRPKKRPRRVIVRPARKA